MTPYPNREGLLATLTDFDRAAASLCPGFAPRLQTLPAAPQVRCIVACGAPDRRRRRKAPGVPDDFMHASPAEFAGKLLHTLGRPRALPNTAARAEIAGGSMPGTAGGSEA